MKISRLLIITLCLGVLVSSSVLGQRRGGARKLPVGTYIKSAKIEILSGDLERYVLAEAYLDSLFMHYGHHAEALFWMTQINVDYIEKTPQLDAKIPYIKKMVAYADTLRMTCDNKDIKKKYRKNCDEYSSQADSTLVSYWREYYNAAVEKLGDIRTTAEDMKADTDPESQAYYTEKLDALQDTVEMSMSMSLLIDSTDHRAYLGLANVHEERGDYLGSAELMIKGLQYVTEEERPILLLKTTYNYFNANKYCDAIPYLSEYCELAPEDVDNMYNMSTILNQCGDYDSALVYFNRILAIDSTNADALMGLGSYHNQMARNAQDSSTAARDAGNEEGATSWTDQRQVEFGNAKGYFERAFAAHPDNADAASKLGLVCFLINEYDCAINAYEKLTVMEPENTDNWTLLGDCYLKTSQFDKSARAYEKVVEADPDNRPIWESLELLYRELKETENIKKAQAHLQ